MSTVSLIQKTKFTSTITGSLGLVYYTWSELRKSERLYQWTRGYRWVENLRTTSSKRGSLHLICPRVNTLVTLTNALILNTEMQSRRMCPCARRISACHFHIQYYCTVGLSQRPSNQLAVGWMLYDSANHICPLPRAINHSSAWPRFPIALIEMLISA